MANLLPFHKTIIESIHDPSTSDLVILARGLGLRRIVCTLMKVYDSPQNLVLLINTLPEEDSAIGAELGLMGCRKPGLRIVGYEMAKRERQELYKKGGLISVTSRILVVDMLQSDIPVDLITGIIVLHAEKVTAVSLEAFIVRLYRERNRTGFLKAFSDQPEHITSGLSPLKNTMKELQLRTVHIYPRFHGVIKDSLEKRKVEVIELYQHLSEHMAEIHTAIMQCMNATLSELKRSHSTLDLDNLTIENAYFQSFDAVVRRQLDSVWHKVAPKTKQLVNDLATLRRLLTYLLTYDALAFHAYLETLVISNSVSATGGVRQHQSPWLLSDAANTIFRLAKLRCYWMANVPNTKDPLLDEGNEEYQGLSSLSHGKAGRNEQAPVSSAIDATKQWLPDEMRPVLEELPKWSLLAAILQEIEEEILRQESSSNAPTGFSLGFNTVLVMTQSTHSSTLIQEFLSTMDPNAPDGAKGRRMMEEKLRLYLWWKQRLSERKQTAKSSPAHVGADANLPTRVQADDNLTEALRRKEQRSAERSFNRRRIRGGAPAATGSNSGRSATIVEEGNLVAGEGEMRQEADEIAAFLTSQGINDADLFTLESLGSRQANSIISGDILEDQFDEHYRLLVPRETVVVRAYSDDSDDQVLAEIQPRFIVMFEPNEDFIRRIEVYRSLNPGLAVRVYHMLYKDSCEEHKLLASMRREKNSFERLIKERATMLLPILHEPASDAGDSIINTINSRIAGGRKELKQEPSRVIVDMREFRSTLPSLLHASKLVVIPATLTVGDYVLTPDMCVERKSIPDLISSFNSGRLYTQCELMSVHYKQPILLIEFEENKAFSLDITVDAKSYTKPNGKYPAKKQQTGPEIDHPWSTTIQSKLALLTLTFPRTRIIWSSSPFATAQIFNDLKLNNAEPDHMKAIAIGADEDSEAGAGINQAAEELLRCLPGVTAKNVKYVMNKVESVKRLCEMDLSQVQEILGAEPGKACWEFMHRGEGKG